MDNSDDFSGSNSGSNSEPQDSEHESVWDSDAAFDSIKMEQQLKPEESDTDLTRRLLEESAPRAALSIINIAFHSRNDNTRLNAARYITDMVLESDSASKAKWEDLIGDVIDKAELFANGN